MAKVLVVGDAATGKTSFIQRACRDQFSHAYQTTIGVDFALKNLEVRGENLKFQLWDIAGQERFVGLARIYYRDAVAAFVLYDVTSRRSFESALSWREDVRKKVFLPNDEPIPVYLIGNKCDMESRQVSEGEARRVQRSADFQAFFQSSAKTGEGVAESLQSMAELVHANNARVAEFLARRQEEEQRQQDPQRQAGGQQPVTLRSQQQRQQHKKDKGGGCC